MTGFFLAFVIGVVFNGFPVHRKFNKVEQDFILESGWFWLAVAGHGLLAMLALYAIDVLNVELVSIKESSGKNLNSDVWKMEDNSWLYAIIAGLSYSSILLYIVNVASLRSNEEQESLRAGIAVYTPLVHNKIKRQVAKKREKFAKNIVDKKLKDNDIENLLAKLTLYTLQKQDQSQAVGRIMDLKNKIFSEFPGDRDKPQIKRLILIRIVEEYTLLVGKSVAQGDFDTISGLA